jgi:hypothetical protein
MILVALRQQPQPEILRHVGVLVLVDEDVAEAAMVLLEHVGPRLEERQAVQQQVAEIAGVQRAQPFLVLAVELHRLTCRDLAAGIGRHLLGRQPAILPALDRGEDDARRPASCRRCARPRATA